MKKKDVLTDEILKKSHAHKEKELIPKQCPACKGFCYITIFIPAPHYDDTPKYAKEPCDTCDGTGEVYE